MARDFLISYSKLDEKWAGWIALELGRAGYTTWSRALDARPGQDLIHEMHNATIQSARTIALLSPAYFHSDLGEVEWRAAYVRDPSGQAGLLIPVRVEPCRPPGLLSSRVYIDLVGKTEEEARIRLTEGVNKKSPRNVIPNYPGVASVVNDHLSDGFGYPGSALVGDQSLSTKHDLKARRGMLLRVRNKWIRDVLHPSMLAQPQIEIWARVHSASPDAQHGVPFAATSLNLKESLSQTSSGLVVIGGPGAGKTTTLLALTGDLLDEAQDDNAAPLPVVFNLSSWPSWQQSLDDWMVNELLRAYRVPVKISRRWIKEDYLLPILDGFDEVPQASRTSCFQAIESYRLEHAFSRYVLISRSAEYQPYLESAELDVVEILPPTTEQVGDYLRPAALSELRKAVCQDPNLEKFLQSPLTLALAWATSNFAGAYSSQAGSATQSSLQALFSAYVESVLDRGNRRYSKRKSKQWLAWLGKSMHDRSQSEFHLDRLQVDWIPRRFRWSMVVILSVVCGLLTGVLDGILYAIVYGAHRGFVNGLAVGLFFLFFAVMRASESERVRSARAETARILFKGRIYTGLAGGAGLGLLMWFIISPTDGVVFGVLLAATFVVFSGASRTTPYEQVEWSLSKALTGALVGLILGAIFGILYGLAYGWRSIEAILIYGSAFASATALFGVVVYGMTPTLVSDRSVPNEGIRRSARRALITGTVAATVATSIFIVFLQADSKIPNPIGAGVRNGAVVGLAVALFIGGLTCLEHLVVRLILVLSGCAPVRVIRFLNHASELRILQRAGDGYIFLHNLLLLYFADEQAPLRDKGLH